MESNHNKKPVRLNDRIKQVGGTLIIKEAKVDDSGKYLCMVNNSVGGESVETVLTVTGYKGFQILKDVKYYLLDDLLKKYMIFLTSN